LVLAALNRRRAVLPDGL